MNNLKRVVGINLIILLIYSILSPFDELWPLWMALLIISQVIMNLIVAIVFFTKGNIVFAKSFLLSAGIILLIGSSVCFGSIYIINRFV